MNPLHPAFALVIYVIAFLTAYLLNLKFKFTTDKSRFENIDGLRGLLAISVFIHHASVWHQFLHLHEWTAPKSNFYNQLGPASVSFFFMITAFLFTNKLLNYKRNNVKTDWRKLYISRLYRLVPMYLITMLLVFSIVFIISRGQLKVDIYTLSKSVFDWLTFTLFGNPTINNFEYTTRITAGVVWSLPYEWMFYFCLPLISLLMLNNKPSNILIFCSILFMMLFYKYQGFNIHHLLSFVGGVITPFLIKNFSNKTNYNSPIFTLLILLCLILIFQYNRPEDGFCKILLIIIFNLIALGNNVFGILKSSILKFLGEVCYSTYLLHGVLLFVLIYLLIGIENSQQLSPEKYSWVIFALTPIVILASFIGFKYVEKPFMLMAKKTDTEK